MAVTWTEASPEDDETTETEAHGDVDESLASRRLRRWLRGMFGGGGEHPPDPSEQDSHDD